MKCSEGLKDLRDQLHNEIADETKADIQYANMAQRLNESGIEYLAEVVRDMSLDERKHYLFLKAIVDVITEECRW